MRKSIDIAIATFGIRIEWVERMLLPPIEGVRYVISWQRHEGMPLPEGLECRGDVEVWRLDEEGVSRNRNNALSHCRSGLVVVADDDLVFRKEDLEGVADAFADEPSLDVALFCVDMPNGKHYPSSDCCLGLPFPKGYWVSCVEIVFRRDRIGDLQFHPGFGPGADVLGCGKMTLGCGEDEMFVISAIRRGYDCRFINRRLCAHPQPSTGGRMTVPILRGQGAVMSMIYSPMSLLLRILLKAWRASRNGTINSPTALRALISGVRAKRNLLAYPSRYHWKL